MSEHPSTAFTKMNGLGNDFIIIDARIQQCALSGDRVRTLAAREHGVTGGCDQLLVIHTPRAQGDAFIQIFNADGNEVEACGNGTRAIAAYLARAGDPATQLETRGGMLGCRAGDVSPNTTQTNMTQVNTAQMCPVIDMPTPKFAASDIPLTSKKLADERINPSACILHADLPPAFLVNVGNPHAVIFVPTGTAGMAAQYGFQLERNPLFLNGANINFASLVGDHIIHLDTWERGVGLTKACGTGACATAIAAIETGLCIGPHIDIRPPANTDDNVTEVITIYYRRADQPAGIDVSQSPQLTVPQLTVPQLTMRGPVSFEFDGELVLCRPV